MNDLRTLSPDELAGRLRKANEAYRLGHPFMSDQQFDLMEERLRTVAPRHPYFSEVGFKPDLASFKHLVPMLSQQKCLTVQELIKFLRSMAGKSLKDFAVSAKLDGMSISSHYAEGKLTAIVSRGDGQTGVIYTDKLRSLFPDCLDIPFTGEVRGELVMSWKNFLQLKDLCKKKGEEEPTHPRNSVVGILSAQDTDPKKISLLNFVAWGLIDKNNSKEKDPWQTYDTTWTSDMAFVKELGFDVVDNAEYLYSSKDSSYEPIIRKFENYKNLMEGYPIDGIIFRVNDNDAFEDLGYTSHHPRAAAAFKFAADEATVTIKEIEWSVGSTGEVTPIAIFDHISLSGANISRASLHNIRFMLDLGLTVGKQATIIRSGEVIPRIVGNPGTFATKDEVLFNAISKCPVCGEPLTFDADYTHTVCNNPKCPGKYARRIELFAKALGIDLFGPANCEILAPTLPEPYSIFDWETQDYIKAGITPGMAANMRTKVKECKEISLEQFLIALGIPTMGPGTAKAFVQAFGSWDKIKDATYSEIINGIARLGSQSATILFEGIAKAKDFADELLKRISIKIIAECDTSNVLANLSIAVTGSLNSRSREEFKKLIENNGGKFASSVSRTTSILICNQASSSTKARKAAELGVKVMTEAEFLNEYRL